MMFSFERINPLDEQISSLYELLNARSHKISHGVKPGFREHEKFVKNHPYRVWYLVNKDGVTVGSFYISHQNTIGINIEGHETPELVLKIINYVQDNYQPLDAIKSVRYQEFAINIAPSNVPLLDVMEKLGAELAQITYHLPDE